MKISKLNIESLLEKGLSKSEAETFLYLADKVIPKKENPLKSEGNIISKIKNTTMFLIERVNAPTPKFWKKTRNYMIAIGGISVMIVLSGSILPAIVVKIASYGISTGAIGTALSQLAKVKEE